MRNMSKPAIFVGTAIALLSSILGLAFILWAIAGGALASYLYVKKSPTPVQMGEGLVMGVMTGTVASSIFLLANMLLLMTEKNVNFGVVFLILAGSAIAVFVLTVIGGLIGVPLFEKRKASSIPPSSTL